MKKNVTDNGGIGGNETTTGNDRPLIITEIFDRKYV